MAIGKAKLNVENLNYTSLYDEMNAAAGITKADDTKQEQQNIEPAATTEPTQKAATPATNTPKSNKKVLCNFKIEESLLQEVKQYCENNYMTLTAGIIKALREMIKEGR